MNKSETIGKLAAALSKLQGEIQNLHKDTQGYGYKYVELSSVLDAARPLLAKYELAVSQLCGNEIMEPSENQTSVLGIIKIETILMHSSGEWISSALSLPVTPGKGMNITQAAGSVITYARRYSLAAILGIAQTDNDAATEKPKDAIIEPPKEPVVNPIWAKAFDELTALMQEKKLFDRVHIWCEHFKVKQLGDLTESQIKQIIKRIEENV